jgi:ABC-2 type transport system ATP-binding protein
MLTTVLHPTSGVIRVDGHDPVREQRQVRRAFGIVFQDPSLDDELTALENMNLHGVLYGVGSHERKAGIEELLRLVELWDRRNDFVKRYSGGMKRRLEIARALLHKPKILFLDEPTIGLDPQTRNHIWSYIQQMSSRQNVTVFFTTHYMEEADRVADDVAVIDHGKIVAQGSPAALKENTQAKTLEDAFIALTGHTIREEEGSVKDRMRRMARVWGRR